jgi:hypothetical protein
MNNWIKELSPDLFWDVDISSVNPESHAVWLLERILQRGRWEDWIQAKNHYGKSVLASYLPKLKLDGKSRHFLTLYCDS